MTVFFLTILLLAILLAWRNLRLRRGDRQGALRLAVVVFVAGMAAQILAGDHHPDFRHELTRFLDALQNSLFSVAVFWTAYIALEPYARRKWPERLISWARLVGGKPRDPMVGRDVLIGLAAGLANASLAASDHWIPTLFDVPLSIVHTTRTWALEGLRQAVAQLLATIEFGLLFGLAEVLLLVVMTLLLRRRPLAIAGFFLVHLTAYRLAWSEPMAIPFHLAGAAFMTVVMVRGGVLPMVATQAVFAATFLYPTVTDWSSWSAPVGVLPLILIIALAVWAFRVALAGQNPFPARLLEE